MVKILVIDNNSLARKGLQFVFENTDDLVVKGEAESCQQGLTIARTNKFDLVILDFAMIDGCAFEVFGNLRLEQPELPILILSMHPSDQFALRFLKAGAAGFLGKKKAAECIVDAIRQIMRGKKYFDDEAAQSLFLQFQTGTQKFKHQKLSDREFQVMRLIAFGYSTKEIADQLNISDNTVRTYRSRIFEKMDLTREAELVRYAVRNGIIT